MWILTPEVSYWSYIFCVHQILEKKWEYNEAVHQLFIDFKKAYHSVRREVLYNILIQSDIPRKLVSLIKMCQNETYNRVCVGKHLSHMFPIKSGLKKRDAVSPLFLNFALEYIIRRVQVHQDSLKMKWYSSASSLCWWSSYFVQKHTYYQEKHRSSSSKCW